jgi:hypothetical protein
MPGPRYSKAGAARRRDVQQPFDHTLHADGIEQPVLAAEEQRGQRILAPHHQ